MNFQFLFCVWKSLTSTEQTEVMSGECLWSDIGASAPGFSQSQGGRIPPQPPPPSSLAPGQSLQSTFHIESLPTIIPPQTRREILERVCRVRANFGFTSLIFVHRSKLRESGHLVASIPRSLFASAAPRRCSHQVLEQMDQNHQSYSKTLPQLGKRLIPIENSLRGFDLE